MEIGVGRTSSVDVQMLQQNSMGTNNTNDQGDQTTKTDFNTDQQHQEQKSTKKEDVRKAVNTLNNLILPHHTNLHFAFHDKLDKYYVQIVDSDTHQVIKEIPPKKFLDAHAATLELLGFLVDKKV